MTRVAILADIHGNLPALEAVLADLAQFAVDRVIVAGDVINWGPFSAQVAGRVLANGWDVIRGNNEFYLLDYETPRARDSWDDRAHFPMLPWLRRQIPPALHLRIAAWPDTISFLPPDAPPLRIVHGSPRSPWEGIAPGDAEGEVLPLLAGVAEGTIVAAHTHLPMDRRIGHWRVLNPGSVGVPLDGHHAASYLLLDGERDGWHATFRRVPFSNEANYREFARQGFVEECGIIGEMVVEEYRAARIGLVPFLNWRREVCPDAPLSAGTLARFRAIDPAPYVPALYRFAGDGE